MEQSQPETQPLIIEDNKKKESNTSNKQNPINSKDSNPQNGDNNNDEEYKRSIEAIQQIRKNHPDCIPVFYVKHEASPKQFPSPKIPFILFNKQLKIQQAMYNLYKQIEVKGLYFFCTRFDQKEKKLKYTIIKPGETIQQIYNKFGRNGHLTLIYGDKSIGMGGINKAEKWLVRVLIVLAAFWVFLYAQPMYYAYESGGLPAVWDTFSLIWNRPQRKAHSQQKKETNKQNKQTAKQQANNQEVVFTQKDIPTQTDQQPLILQEQPLTVQEQQQILL